MPGGSQEPSWALVCLFFFVSRCLVKNWLESRIEDASLMFVCEDVK